MKTSRRLILLIMVFLFLYTPQIQAELKTIDANLSEKENQHEVDLTKDQPLVISMTSTEFDTYLVINDPDGKKVVHDDDGGKGTNSLIVFTPQKTGKYQLVASSFQNSGKGKYKIDYGSEENWLFGEIKADAPKVKGTIPYSSHMKKLEKGKKYTFHLITDSIHRMDCYLLLRKDEEILAENDDVQLGDFNSKIVFTPEEDGDYELLAGSLGKAGAYVLKIMVENGG